MKKFNSLSKWINFKSLSLVYVFITVLPICLFLKNKCEIDTDLANTYTVIGTIMGSLGLTLALFTFDDSDDSNETSELKKRLDEANSKLDRIENLLLNSRPIPPKGRK